MREDAFSQPFERGMKDEMKPCPARSTVIQNVFFSGNIGFKIEIDYVSGDRPDVCMAHQKVDLTIEKVTTHLDSHY